MLFSKTVLIAGLLATSMSLVGCDALNPHKMCEAELTETKAQLAHTQQIAKNLSVRLQQQQAELDSIKRVNAANVRREKQQAVSEIDSKRAQLDQERFEIDRIRAIEQADLEE